MKYTKICTLCKEEKSLDHFYKAKHSKDGYSWRCKLCYQKRKPKAKDEYKICSKCKTEKFIEDFAERVKHKDGRDSHCKDCKKEYDRAYREKNRELLRDKWSNSYYSNEEFRSKRISNSRLRHLRKKKAVPKWDDNKVSKATFSNLYLLRKMLSKLTKQKWEIDHIIPLNGSFEGFKVVCGLHTPCNLDIILEEDNRKKLNLYWKDMWDYASFIQETRDFLK